MDIKKRGATSYLLTVSCGTNKEGDKVRKRKTINLAHIPEKKREAEAEKEWYIFEQEVTQGLYIDSKKITFEGFSVKWIKDYATPTY